MFGEELVLRKKNSSNENEHNAISDDLNEAALIKEEYQEDLRQIQKILDKEYKVIKLGQNVSKRGKEKERIVVNDWKVIFEKARASKLYQLIEILSGADEVNVR
jgi:hypothetical protein